MMLKSAYANFVLCMGIVAAGFIKVTPVCDDACEENIIFRNYVQTQKLPKMDTVKTSPPVQAPVQNTQVYLPAPQVLIRPQNPPTKSTPLQVRPLAAPRRTSQPRNKAQVTGVVQRTQPARPARVTVSTQTIPRPIPRQPTQAPIGRPGIQKAGTSRPPQKPQGVPTGVLYAITKAASPPRACTKTPCVPTTAPPLQMLRAPPAPIKVPTPMVSPPEVVRQDGTKLTTEELLGLLAKVINEVAQRNTPPPQLPRTLVPAKPIQKVVIPIPANVVRSVPAAPKKTSVVTTRIVAKKTVDLSCQRVQALLREIEALRIELRKLHGSRESTCYAPKPSKGLPWIVSPPGNAKIVTIPVVCAPLAPVPVPKNTCPKEHTLSAKDKEKAATEAKEALIKDIEDAVTRAINRHSKSSFSVPTRRPRVDLRKEIENIIERVDPSQSNGTTGDDLVMSGVIDLFSKITQVVRDSRDIKEPAQPEIDVAVHKNLYENPQRSEPPRVIEDAPPHHEPYRRDEPRHGRVPYSAIPASTDKDEPSSTFDTPRRTPARNDYFRSPWEGLPRGSSEYRPPRKHGHDWLQADPDTHTQESLHHAKDDDDLPEYIYVSELLKSLR